MGSNGHVELDWATESIRIGVRHRHDLGDIDSLAQSIQTHGLLQPVTITPGDVLICGARRLAAIKQLGWKTTSVWVRPGLSGQLAVLMAERDENSTHKPLSMLEAATLYDELKAEIAADAARRVAATQFSRDYQPGGNAVGDGLGKFTAPSEGRNNQATSGVADSATPPGSDGFPVGDARRQAAAVIGGPSYTTLEKVGYLRQIAADETKPAAIRDMASGALEQIGAGKPVDRLFSGVRATARICELETLGADESQPETVRDAASRQVAMLRGLRADPAVSPRRLDKAAAEALGRVEAAKHTQAIGRNPVVRKRQSVATFIWTWNELADWPDQYDPAAVADGLSDAQWDRFCHTMKQANQFMAAVEELRHHGVAEARQDHSVQSSETGRAKLRVVAC